MDDFMLIEYLKSKGIISDTSNAEHKSDKLVKDDFTKGKASHMESEGEHFNESYAKYLVANMYHFSNGKKHIGEKFDMSRTKEIYEQYKSIIPHGVTCADVYVALNSQYHDFSRLFKSWFGDNVEHQIIESAILFWFKDDDYMNNHKLWDYFKRD